MSRRGLERAFRKFFNHTVSEHLQHKRLSVAKTLLCEDNDLSIQQVAYLAGFTSPRSFFRAFAAAEGTTPLRYRIEHRT